MPLLSAGKVRTIRVMDSPATNAAAGQTRDYAGLRARVRAFSGDRAARMQAFVDAAWDAFREVDVSWIGFYLIAEGEQEMRLGARRDKPACSPIGLHGACGKAWRERRTLIVRDVRELGAGYIACDPRDLSELVIPLFDPAIPGVCWGVLDVDSFSIGAFDEADARGMLEALRAGGLTA